MIYCVLGCIVSFVLGAHIRRPFDFSAVVNAFSNGHEKRQTPLKQTRQQKDGCPAQGEDENLIRQWNELLSYNAKKKAEK